MDEDDVAAGVDSPSFQCMVVIGTGCVEGGGDGVLVLRDLLPSVLVVEHDVLSRLCLSFSLFSRALRF